MTECCHHQKIVEIATTKRGIPSTLVLRIKNLELDRPLRRVEFVFKQRIAEWAEELVYRCYEPGVNNSNIWYNDGLFYVDFSAEDTRKFRPEEEYYIDTIIEYEDGYFPICKMAKLYNMATLFSEAGG